MVPQVLKQHTKCLVPIANSTSDSRNVLCLVEVTEAIFLINSQQEITANYRVCSALIIHSILAHSF